MYTICPKCRTPYQGMGCCTYCGVALIDYNAYMQWLQQQQQLMQQPQQQQLAQQPQQQHQPPQYQPPLQAQPIAPNQQTAPNMTNHSQTVIIMPNMQQGSIAQPQNNASGLRCRKCGSSNVSCQAVNEVYSRTQHRGVFWWIFVGWWWLPIKWLVFTLPALIVKMFSRKKTYVASKTVTKAVCQNCGFTWNC